MPGQTLAIQYLGGPSALIELASTRLLVDPTFDVPGTYPIGARVLTKTARPALQPTRVGPVDPVLLSHDQHPDNVAALSQEWTNLRRRPPRRPP
jgi:L-ascorbate metabolism protein UlaG (beta-lactamase superfamily)